jgi:hypothetical protein
MGRWQYENYAYLFSLPILKKKMVAMATNRLKTWEI